MTDYHHHLFLLCFIDDTQLGSEEQADNDVVSFVYSYSFIVILYHRIGIYWEPYNLVSSTI